MAGKALCRAAVGRTVGARSAHQRAAGCLRNDDDRGPLSTIRRADSESRVVARALRTPAALRAVTGTQAGATNA